MPRLLVGIAPTKLLGGLLCMIVQPFLDTPVLTAPNKLKSVKNIYVVNANEYEFAIVETKLK